MSREKMLFALDRVPRYASLLGLLGLLGVAGVVEPDLYRFSVLSVLSFLSYSSFFRYFRGFIDPSYGPTRESVPFIAFAVFVGAIFPWLPASSPMFGFVGFAGFCGLFDRREGANHRLTATS